jgi:hypothetical protein
VEINRSETMNRQYTLEQLDSLFAEYLLTLDDENSNEYYFSDKFLADTFVGDFLTWLKERDAH